MKFTEKQIKSARAQGSEMKERPKVGDHVEFKSHRYSQIGKIIAVAVTGMHFLVESPIGHKHRNRKIGLTGIIRILPGDG